jgi:hypothetical protein
MILITQFLGLEALAIYGMAKAFFLQTANLPAVIGNVFVNRILGLTGRNAARSHLAKEALDFLLIEYLVLFPLLICVAVHSFAFLTSAFIPDYAIGTPLISVLVFAIYFVPQTTLIRNFWMIDRRLIPLLRSNAIGLLGMLLGQGVTIFCLGLTLQSVVIGTVAGYAIYYFGVLLTIGRELWGISSVSRLVLKLSLSFAVTQLAVTLVPPSTAIESLHSAFTTLLVNTLLSLVVVLPIGIYGVWHTGLIKLVTRSPLLARDNDKVNAFPS